MAQNKNIFQKLTDVVIGLGDGQMSKSQKVVSNYELLNNNDVIFSSRSKEERDAKLLKLRQEKLLAYQWGKINYDTSMDQLQGANAVKVMLRDCDLMDAWPEIGAALDVYAEEITVMNFKTNKILNIYSKSERVRSILEDLFVNRLDIHVTLPMIARATCKYGNEYMFLNIDSNNGVMGWRELPVHEMKRVENGMQANNGISGVMSASAGNLKPNEVKFVWEGHNENIPYKNWQVAHFRLIKDSLFLPYGVSILHKARRHWRMLSMMEDAMLLYRLERSIERRIFKVNVGAIDDADVQAYLQEFMNNVKRAPIIDPATGQMDLRKNFLDVSADYVIPVRNGQDPTDITTLQAAQNTTSMEDIEYIQNKVLSALRTPKTFINFQEPQGKGQNLSIMDIRFSRAVNSIQQALIMELNKIAIIHLSLLGFNDDITNFSLTLNNPSNQLEAMELDNLAKRITAASQALQEQGGGIPLMSWHQVQSEIMGRTDAEISDMLNEIRLENALANEIQMTTQIIQKTGLFDKVDRIYGEPDAKYQQGGGGDQEGGPGGPGGGPMMGGDFGGGLDDIGAPGGDDMGDVGGAEGDMDLGEMGGEEQPMENIHIRDGRQIISEQNHFNEYLALLNKNDRQNLGEVTIIDDNFKVNENLDLIIKQIDDFSKE